MSPNNVHTVHSIRASAQSLFAFLIVCKSVEASGDYYTEEGAADGNCRICLWSPLWCNMRPSARIRAAIAPLAQPSCHRSHDEPTAEFEKPAECEKSWKHQLQPRNERERRISLRFLPLKEMKTRGAAIGSLITGFPRAKPVSARRAWTVHRPSSCMVDQPPVAHRKCF